MKYDPKPVQFRLSKLKPNAWNPNRMDEATWRMFVDGMRRDGWIMSQSILVWRDKNVIIDGEHRYRAATELGYTLGPVVFIDDITESQAKTLTIALNAKRGEFDSKSLGDVIRSIVDSGFSSDDLASELGFTDEDFTKYLSPPPEVPQDDFISDGESGGSSTPEPASEMGKVELFFTKEDRLAYLELEQMAIGILGYTKAYEALREACLRALQ